MVRIVSFTRLSADTTAFKTEVSALDLTKGLKDRYEQYRTELQDDEESAEPEGEAPGGERDGFE